MQFFLILVAFCQILRKIPHNVGDFHLKMTEMICYGSTFIFPRKLPRSVYFMSFRSQAVKKLFMKPEDALKGIVLEVR